MNGYFAEKYGVSFTNYDVRAPQENKWASGCRSDKVVFKVFDGRVLPAEADRSYDSVIINSVLHHAADASATLLREAARIARERIVLIEDLWMEPKEFNRAFPMIHRRHRYHEPHGIFRTQHEWVQMLQNRTGFAVVDIAPVIPQNYTDLFRYYHAGAHRTITFQRIFVAVRCSTLSSNKRRSSHKDEA